MNIVVIDNYDSFTYNLVYILKELGGHVKVFRNDKISLEEVKHYDKVLLSPGPGLPAEAGIMQDITREYAQVRVFWGFAWVTRALRKYLVEAFENMGEVLHGVATKALIIGEDERLFQGIPAEVKVGRYHSWTVIPQTLPDSLKVTALDENGKIMALSHRTYDVKGVQFHPESVLTEHGKRMLENWLSN